ncbi:hypothetical protein Tco_1353500 [Tanacetum coccineum]|uniref:Uncharacterized protein n=1 Tax=Tanacetum coccineum TaxID=301880 RepID=A0ABQ4WN09_9ASTR
MELSEMQSCCLGTSEKFRQDGNERNGCFPVCVNNIRNVRQRKTLISNRWFDEVILRNLREKEKDCPDLATVVKWNDV